ncbi:MAG TPA: Holliday junction resolvase RuvX [Acidimicrobiia bacterium]|jgi:putative Holliday junction resolvase
MSRALGVDLGTRRIGLALSDPTGTVASPYAVLTRSADRGRDHAAIVAAARETEAATIVVGLPLSLSGRVGPAARATLDEVDELRAAAEAEGLAVETLDERLTTVIAHQGMRAANTKRDARRRDVDKVAAAVMLQSYLDRAR